MSSLLGPPGQAGGGPASAEPAPQEAADPSKDRRASDSKFRRAGRVNAAYAGETATGWPDRHGVPLSKRPRPPWMRLDLSRCEWEASCTGGAAVVADHARFGRATFWLPGVLNQPARDCDHPCVGCPLAAIFVEAA
jgi:hypothetical protein